jgi:hypothetical protein
MDDGQIIRIVVEPSMRTTTAPSTKEMATKRTTTTENKNYITASSSGQKNDSSVRFCKTCRNDVDGQKNEPNRDKPALPTILL